MVLVVREFFGTRDPLIRDPLIRNPLNTNALYDHSSSINYHVVAQQQHIQHYLPVQNYQQ